MPTMSRSFFGPRIKRYRNKALQAILLGPNQNTKLLHPPSSSTHLPPWAWPSFSPRGTDTEQPSYSWSRIISPDCFPFPSWSLSPPPAPSSSFLALWLKRPSSMRSSHPWCPDGLGVMVGLSAPLGICHTVPPGL